MRCPSNGGMLTPPLQLHLDELAGRPLTDIRTIVELITATKTTTGLAVQCAYDSNWYPRGQKISDTDLAAIPLAKHNWHGDWNYDIKP